MIIIKRDGEIKYHKEEEVMKLVFLISMYDPFQYDEMDLFIRFYNWNQK